jgi:uncharacterized protein YbjT (DUF2867 family)
MRRCVFVTGGTGYIGRALITMLIARGHTVCALARAANAHRVPAGAAVIEGDALDAATFIDAVASADTFVHLIGTPHPNPFKAKSFESVDRRSVDAAIDAACAGGVRHFVYVSVAQPAPVMRAYVKARAAGEARIRASGIAATILRPWYVLGPGHRWAYLLVPFYGIFSWLPPTRAASRRLGLVTLEQMVSALIGAVELGPADWRVLDVAAIRSTSACAPS